MSGWAVSAHAANEVVAKPIVLNDNGAWSWFEDERAIIDPVGGKLLVSSVADSSGAGGVTRDGDVDVVSLDLGTKQVDSFVLHADLEDDDHNSAALYVRPDGRYVAMYGKHISDRFSRYRISTNPHDATAWEAEEVFVNDAGATYNNLHYLPNDNGGAGRLYNFTRTNNFDPNVIYSTDQGENWTYGGKLLTEGGGSDRPYVRYFSDGDKIHFITTERHPRNYDNSVYHGYIQDGQLFNSAGGVIDSNLFDGSGAAPSQLTPILTTGTVFDGESMRHGWTVDVAIANDGSPVAVHQARADNDSTNHRFFYSRWDGAQWQTNSLGYAGSFLYGAENDYTGLVAIDPDNVNTVYLSSEVHPATKAQLIGADGERHYELFRGTTENNGQTWDWTPLTYNSTEDNIRPIVPKWDTDNTALLWLRGQYNTYVNYDLDVVGLINPDESPITLGLSVDFGANGQVVQSGFEAFTRSGGGPSGSQSEAYASPFAATPSGVTVSLGGDIEFRDRGNDTNSPVGDIVDDFVFANDKLTLTLSDLVEGDYQIVLYAHDRDFAQGDYEVSIEGKQVGLLAPTDGADPLVGVASGRYWFHTDGQSDVVLSLDSVLGGAVLLDGFELYAAPAPFVAPPIDFNGDGQLDFSDYQILTENLHSDLADLTSQEAYARGDVNGDLISNYTDFALFREAYEDWNGTGSFASMAVPEPGAVVMMSGLLLSYFVTQRTTPENPASTPKSNNPTAISAISE